MAFSSFNTRLPNLIIIIIEYSSKVQMNITLIMIFVTG